MQKFTPEQKEKRRIYHMEWLANRTPEKVKADRIAKYACDKRSYANKTPEQKQIIFERNKQRRLNRTPEQKKAFLVYQSFYRLNETIAKRKLRLENNTKRILLESPEKKQVRCFRQKQDYRNRTAFIRKKGWEKNSPTGTFFKLVLTPDQRKEVNAYVIKCGKEDNKQPKKLPIKRTNQYYVDYRASLSQERKDIISERLKVKCANRSPEKIASDKEKSRIYFKSRIIGMSDKQYAAYKVKNNIRRQASMTRLQSIFANHLFKIKDYDNLINFNSLFPTEQHVLSYYNCKSNEELLCSLQAKASVKTFEERDKKQQLKEKIQIISNTEKLFVGENDMVELSIGI